MSITFDGAGFWSKLPDPLRVVCAGADPVPDRSCYIQGEFTLVNSVEHSCIFDIIH